MDPRFKNGVIGRSGNGANANKQTGSDSIPTLGGALNELSKCNAGGHSQLGYATYANISTTDNDLWIVFVYSGAVTTLVASAVNRQAAEDCYCGDCTDLAAILA